MWYAYEGEWMNWHKITTDQAREIIELNKKKEKVASLEEYASELEEEVAVTFENVVGQDSLTRFDSPKGNKKRKNNKSRNRNNSNSSNNKLHNKQENNSKPKAKHKPRPRPKSQNKPKDAK